MTQVTISTVDLARFDAIAATPGITMLDFTAAWCGPCKTLTPVLVALEAEYRGRFRLFAIDVDHDPELARRFDVRSMPTVVLLQDGREIGRVVGVRSRDHFRELLDRMGPVS
jgi:thioredoxin